MPLYMYINGTRKKQYTRCGAFLLHSNGMAEETKEMVRLMNEVMEGWQEM